MGRRKRKIIPNGIYHVAIRVNDHHRWFEKPEVCELYLAALINEKRKNKFKIFAFSLMPTHPHLILQTKDTIAPLNKVMQALNANFAKEFHKLYATRGHFWRARYFSRPLFSDNELLAALRYVANNPVKGKLVSDPMKHTYNSIRKLQNNTLFSQVLSELAPQIKKQMIELCNIKPETPE